MDANTEKLRELENKIEILEGKLSQKTPFEWTVNQMNATRGSIDLLKEMILATAALAIISLIISIIAMVVNALG